MSLLLTSIEPNLISLAQTIFDSQFAEDPRLVVEMDERRKRLMFEDILYNFSFLTTAVNLEDGTIFTNYAVWLYELLCNLMKDLDRDRIKDQMVGHYCILRRFSQKLFGEDRSDLANTYLDQAIKATEMAVDNIEVSPQFLQGRHQKIRRDYLNALLRSDTNRAIQIIRDAEAQGIEIDQIYEDIIRLTMLEVGELWHKNIITVDKEHYCTSTTQMILSLFYPTIFSQPSKQKKILTCCIGSELHEMGGRMVSDLFEYHGWESIYLGAAVPVASLLHAIEEHTPDLVALSVTMPQYLGICHEAVVALRNAHPSLLIAVGGRAFSTSNAIYTRWPIDIYTELATELLYWAEKAVQRQ
ncbi:MAG: B12-binding domain-containing protein [Sphaerochaeta sp.]|jgi:methanogenic corrinoid protein MtbC1|uniref:cobalamin B12-binding domain-containing protein n=1 Tax=Sphaerochaeta sp. TaxID=1972642 RepID=UPI003D11642B